MKRCIRLGATSLMALFIAACGSEQKPESRLLSSIRQDNFIVETFEISLSDSTPSESQRAEIFSALEAQQSQFQLKHTPLDSQLAKDNLEDGIGDRIDTLNRIINAFADIMKKVVAPDTPLMKGNVIAEARPEGLNPMNLQNSKYSGKSYRKIFKSLLGFTLVETEYKVSYAYGADNNGKGQYIPYVLFTPMKIVLDRLWHLEADSLSLTPRNCGTLENPIAALEFNLAFKAKGLTGTIMATDTFSLNAQTGELVADGRDFQP